MPERRYDDAETAAIFKAAAELQQAGVAGNSSGTVTPAAGEGMTLAQLQDIGREVGIPAEMVARAADGLSRRGRADVRLFLGLPIGVGRTIALEHKLTEQQWERLVVDLRETFDARGRVSQDGNFRQWTNGNLHALLEPTSTGQQLRLRTMKADAALQMTLGLGGATVSGVLYAMLMAAGRSQRASMALVMGAATLALAVVGAVRIPAWARLRRRQMEAIAARLVSGPTE